jgi:hypothetical protein
MGPLGTSATEWPVVPAPGDEDDGEFGGMKIGRGNRSTRRKPAPRQKNHPLLRYHFIPFCMLHCPTCYFICILECYCVYYFVLVE